jgi:DNA polymerase/3'-5' exonuclease PolX
MSAASAATALTADPDMKPQIIAALEIMRKKEVADKQPFKARAYKKAIDGIKLLDSVTSYEDVKGVEGIGAKIEEKIKELLETGRLASAERAAASHKPHEELMNVYGIGPAKATELIESGITGVEMLRAAVKKNPGLLNDKQKIGLLYYEDLIKRIPFEEMLEHQSILEELLPKEVDASEDMQIVGSFRREMPDSGDIDVLIRVKEGGNPGKLLVEYIKMMEGFGYLRASLAQGDKKYMGICQLPGHPARRLDILMTPENEYAYAVLYFTGSDTFNIAMRHHALAKGYTLNEHKLTPLSKAVDDPPEMKTEKDIFRFLKIKYVEPRDRKSGTVVTPYRKLKFVAEEGTD